MARETIATSCWTILLLSVTAICVESNNRPPDNAWSTNRYIERDFLEPETANNKEILLKYLKLTLDALEKALIYLDKHIDDVNLDGVIGPRQSESKIGFLVSKYWTVLPPEISRKMKDIVVASGKFSNAAELKVKKATPQYYAKSYPLIKPHFHDLFFPPRPINISLLDVFHKRTKAFSEKESDDCLTEFFGNTGQPRCQISDQCWKIMTAKKQRFYSLTHEVFYLVSGIQANCYGEITKTAFRENGKSVAHLLDYFCANVYKEALQIESNGMKMGMRDLFMEQIGLCGDAGYIEIGKWRWLVSILKWQRSNGCYGLFEGEIMDFRNFDPKGYGKTKRSLPYRNRRVKRTEQIMSSDGCLSHRISVAVSALNTYVRRLVGHIIGETV